MISMSVTSWTSWLAGREYVEEMQNEKKKGEEEMLRRIENKKKNKTYKQ